MEKERLLEKVMNLSEEEQIWIFNKLMGHLWPDLAGKKVALVEATGFYADDDGWTEEDYEYFRKKAEEWKKKAERSY